MFVGAKYAKLIWDLFSENATPFNVPRRSDWRVTGTGGSSVNIDVADIATLGATTVIPVNLNASVGTTEIALRHTTAHLSVILEGVGAGAGIGVGWGLPVSFTYGGGELGIESISLGRGMDLPSSGIGCLLAGPKANSVVISPNDLVTPTAEPGGIACMTLASASAGTQAQYSIGIALFADRPVVDAVDLAYTKAVALIAGMDLAVGTAVGAGVSAAVFKMKIRESSLPFPGARYGASVMGA